MRITAYFVFPPKVAGGDLEYRPRVITSENSLREALEDLVLINCSYLEKYPNLPDVYNRQAGLRYIREPAGQEFWLTYPVLVMLGGGDCEDLACARAAKLRQSGDTRARAYLYHKGNLWHVMTMRGDGTIEDPSAALGMYDAREELT